MQKLSLILMILIMTSCAGIKSLKLETTPTEAQVFLYDLDQKKYINVGQTPLELDKKMIDKYVKNGNDFVAVRIEKSGHAIEHLIYDVKTKKKIEYLLQLKPLELWSDKEGVQSSNLANDIAKKIQMINRAILGRNLDVALSSTNNLIDLYPRAYIFYDIKGSIHLLKGNKNKAIASLRKSLAINPGNVDTEKMLKALDKTGGVQ